MKNIKNIILFAVVALIGGSAININGSEKKLSVKERAKDLNVDLLEWTAPKTKRIAKIINIVANDQSKETQLEHEERRNELVNIEETQGRPFFSIELLNDLKNKNLDASSTQTPAQQEVATTQNTTPSTTPNTNRSRSNSTTSQSEEQPNTTYTIPSDIKTLVDQTPTKIDATITKSTSNWGWKSFFAVAMVVVAVGWFVYRK